MRKLALAAAAFSAAVFLSHYVLGAPQLFYAAAVCAALALSAFFFKKTHRLRIVIICVFLAAGFLWNALYARLYLDPAASLDGVTGTVSAAALGAPEKTDYGFKLPVSVRRNGAPDIKTRLYVFGGLPGIEAGNQLSFTARFKLADTVYSADTDAYFAKGIFLLAYAEGEITVTDAKTPVRFWPARIADASGRMADHIFPGNIQDFMRALLLGDSAGVYSDSVFSSAMSETGASHIVAVSGMHLSFLVGFLNLVIKKKRRLAACAIPLIFIFISFVGFRPSLARAGVMQVFLLAAPLFKRECDALTSLSASLMLILLINPFSAASAGLQLSFASTLGIALFADKLYTRFDEPLRFKKIYRYKPVRSAVRFFTGGLASTLGALSFSVPLTALHFGTVSLLAPVTNLLILLPTSLAFGTGMLALILGFICAPVGIAAAFIAALPAQLVTAVIRLLSRAPFAAVYTSSPAAVIWLVYVYSLLLAFWFMRARLRQLLLPACCCAVSLCLILVGAAVFSDSRGFSVTALDVGQGQSIVLTSGRYTAVVDCGSSSGKDAGDLLVRHLKSCGRSKIDLLILTHFHTDHACGVEEILERFPVSALAVPEPSEDSGGLAAGIMALSAEKGIRTVCVTENLTAYMGDTSLNLYAPIGDSDENERGVVILASSGDFDVLITGDIGAETERLLLAAGDFPDIEVLVAGHHGSKYATCDELLTAVTPELALVSTGYNTYGHPAPETLEKLARTGILTYRTDILGNLTVKAW